MTLVRIAASRHAAARLSRGSVPNITDEVWERWETLANPQDPRLIDCLNSLDEEEENGHEARTGKPFWQH
jgi:hypothetical protein